MVNAPTCKGDRDFVSGDRASRTMPLKREVVLQETPGKQIAVIPSLSPRTSDCVRLGPMSNDVPKQEVKSEPTIADPQSARYDFNMIADAQRRHKRIVDRIEAALAMWKPTIHAGSNNGTAIECPAAVVRENTETQRAQTPAGNRSTSQTFEVQDEDSYIPDPYQQAAIAAAEAGENFFLTGSAGTGKSFVLKQVIKLLRAKGKEVAVTASTGCAAVAIRGNTIHSATGVGLGLDPPKVLQNRARTQSRIREMLSSIDVLVLDEVSMIDSLLFDKIELVFSTARAAHTGYEQRKQSEWARKRRRTTIQEEDVPFGGVQVIVCGDFFQLPPVAASDYKLRYTKEKYFAFEAEAWKRAIKKTIMLRVVHRQSDRNFVGLLNEIRHGVVSGWSRDVLQACQIAANEDNLEIKPNGDPLPFTKLYSHRKQVDLENYSRLHKIKDYPGVKYEARDRIDEEELGTVTRGAAQTLLNNVPGLDVTELKERCRVLCVKNIDKSRGVVNGSTGYVVGFQLPREAMQIDVKEWEWMTPEQRHKRYAELTKQPAHRKVSLRDNEMQENFRLTRRDPVNGFLMLDGEAPEVVPVVRFDNGEEMAVWPTRWDVYGTKGQIIAWRSQIPLVLGWALSIHKSQGMSLELVQTELARAFDFGQVYVAISRATSVQGLRLTSFDRNRVMAHDKVLAFYAGVEQEDARHAAKRVKRMGLLGANDIIEID